MRTCLPFSLLTFPDFIRTIQKATDRFPGTVLSTIPESIEVLASSLSFISSQFNPVHLIFIVPVDQLWDRGWLIVAQRNPWL